MCSNYLFTGVGIILVFIYSMVKDVNKDIVYVNINSVCGSDFNLVLVVVVDYEFFFIFLFMLFSMFF